MRMRYIFRLRRRVVHRKGIQRVRYGMNRRRIEPHIRTTQITLYWFNFDERLRKTNLFTILLCVQQLPHIPGIFIYIVNVYAAFNKNI